jgi:hypothetical protein
MTLMCQIPESYYTYLIHVLAEHQAFNNKLYNKIYLE